jgi:asparagine synthase (glutamine-hydrolysing)
VLGVNGEIYNHVALRKKLKKKHSWQTKSDCEVILYLYDEHGPGFLDMLNGIFAFVLYDKKSGDFFIAPDHMGICPLYIGWAANGTTYAASEMKSLSDSCEKIEEFPPGHYYLGSEKTFVKWYAPGWAETFDVTTVRAATPMYLMARKIKSMGIKMVLSGEGADEVESV